LWACALAFEISSNKKDAIRKLPTPVAGIGGDYWGRVFIIHEGKCGSKSVSAGADVAAAFTKPRAL